MDTTQTPAPEPDMIGQVGQMLNRLAGGKWSNPAHATAIGVTKSVASEVELAVENTMVLASAILAVAAELRAVRNELVDFQLAWVARQ